jgi:hypothetical protein
MPRVSPASTLSDSSRHRWEVVEHNEHISADRRPAQDTGHQLGGSLIPPVGTAFEGHRHPV